MDFTLLEDGFFVMIIGMSTVFVFLTVMIWVMYLNGYILKFVNRYFPEETAEEKIKQRASVEDEEIALAIACASAQRGV